MICEAITQDWPAGLSLKTLVATARVSSNADTETHRIWCTTQELAHVRFNPVGDYDYSLWTRGVPVLRDTNVRYIST